MLVCRVLFRVVVSVDLLVMVVMVFKVGFIGVRFCDLMFVLFM